MRACDTLRDEGSFQVYKYKRVNQTICKFKIKDIYATRVRYGYGRLHVMLRRAEIDIYEKRILRLYNALGLQLRNKPTMQGFTAKHQHDRALAAQINEKRELDNPLVFNGIYLQKLRCLLRLSRLDVLDPDITFFSPHQPLAVFVFWSIINPNAFWPAPPLDDLV